MSEFDERFIVSSLAAHPHERRGGGSLPTRLIKLDSPAHEVIDPATSDLVVGLVLKGQGGASWSWDGAKPNTTLHRREGTLGVTPVGAVGRFEVDGQSSILIVAMPFEGLFERLDGELKLKRDLGPLHDAYADHRIARRLCLRLWRLAQNPCRVADLGIDWLSEELAVGLAAASGERSMSSVSGALGTREKARIQAVAESVDVDVGDLASAIAMPIRTFRRRFHASFGVSPHNWLIRRRIELSRRLVLDGTLSLSQVALDLGFSSQAHFTDVFRREIGVSPGRFRRAMR